MSLSSIRVFVEQLSIDKKGKQMSQDFYLHSAAAQKGQRLGVSACGLALRTHSSQSVK